MTELVPTSGAFVRAVDSLDRLHRVSITDPDRVRDLLARMRDQHVTLHRGMNRRIDPELAWIEHLGPDRMRLRTQDFEPGRRAMIFLNGSMDGHPYFLSAPFIRDLRSGSIEVALPAAIYRAERRGRERRAPATGASGRVRLEGVNASFEAEIQDISSEGMGVLVPQSASDALGEQVEVHFLDGDLAERVAYGEVRHRVPLQTRKGWSRLGLDLAPAPRNPHLVVERRSTVLPSNVGQRTERRLRVMGAGVRVATDRVLSALGRRTKLPQVRIVDYENSEGERLRGILDQWGDPRGSTAIVIPPAWGRTKETLMPLAATLVAGFRNVGEPIVVLRFDGIRKRGESHNEPECRASGKEHHRFTFSQGVRDIRASIDFLEQSPEFRPRRVLLVSFSAASIESRRAVATDPRISGWICVVGAPDAQSMLRVISGGIDFVIGIERGLRFGLQEVLGIEVDLDHAHADLTEHRLVCLDDSRRDFSRITVPVTWIQGTHDAWMDADRVRDVMSRGDTRRRKLIEVPTGHMLKNSREALETFQLVTREASEMALGHPIEPTLPDIGQLQRRQRAERERLPRKPEPRLKEFWNDYLVGRQRDIGIELMTHTAAYRDLMVEQVEALDLKSGQRIVDLGSGTGTLPLHLARHSVAAVQVIEVDFVRAGLIRARERLRQQNTRPDLDVRFVEADLDGQRTRSMPLADASADAVLAGLLLSYVADPTHLLREIRRILRPGGRLVVSSLRRDADMSKLYVEGVEELRNSNTQMLLSSHGLDFDRATRDYLNQASRLLDLEEEGRFRFWDLPELDALVREAGLQTLTGCRSFGSPPQAVVVSALRR